MAGVVGRIWAVVTLRSVPSGCCTNVPLLEPASWRGSAAVGCVVGICLQGVFDDSMSPNAILNLNRALMVAPGLLIAVPLLEPASWSIHVSLSSIIIFACSRLTARCVSSIMIVPL